MSPSAEKFKSPLHSSFDDEIGAFVLSKYQLLKVMVEWNFVELVDLLNYDRACCLEAAWIIEDISLIRGSLSYI